MEHSGLPVKKTLDELQVPRSTFYRWYNLYQEDGLEGLIDHRPNPRQIWNRIPQEVKQQVVELALQHPDRSPMKKAISSEKFVHPTTHVHEPWQADFTYFKILDWGWYYLSTVLDDFSRYIIAWKLTPTMNANDVQDTLLIALNQTGLDHVLVEHRPRLLSDNGSCYVSKELKDFLERKHIAHTHSAPYHPMTQGKIERYHRSMKNIVNLQNYFLPGKLESEITSFVAYYNHQRYHESLDNLTPADVYFGRAKEVLSKRDEIKKKTFQQRRLQNTQVAAV